MTKTRTILELDEAWELLPLLFCHQELEARWLPALEKYGQFQFVEELGAGAWGQLAECGWQEALSERAPRQEGGSLEPEWADSVVEAANLLAANGAYQGPSGDASHWLSYLMHALSDPCDLFEHLLVQSGELPLEVASTPPKPKSAASDKAPKTSDWLWQDADAEETYDDLHKVHLINRIGWTGKTTRARFAVAIVFDAATGYRIIHRNDEVADERFMAMIEATFEASQQRVYGEDFEETLLDGTVTIGCATCVETVYPGDPNHFMVCIGDRLSYLPMT